MFKSLSVASGDPGYGFSYQIRVYPLIFAPFLILVLIILIGLCLECYRDDGPGIPAVFGQIDS